MKLLLLLKEEFSSNKNSDIALKQKEYMKDQFMLFSFCERLSHEEDFFIRKAVGWALREYSKTLKESVKNFLNEYKNSMSNLTFREASKYL